MAQAQAKMSEKEMRLAKRWVPKDYEKVTHPDGEEIAVCYVSKVDPRGHVCVLAYRGSAYHNAFHYSYKNRVEADAKVANFFQAVSSWKDSMKNRRAVRAAEREIPIKHGDYVPAAHVAKLVKELLAKKFPNVKFSVRSDSYSMGAAVDVYWTDGPTEKEVEKFTDPFEGSGFDGMIDLKYHVDSWLLPDGTATYASSQGTTGSRGVFDAYDHPKPHHEAIKFHSGADYVHLRRQYSKERLELVANYVADQHGMKRPQVKVWESGGAHLDGPEVGQRLGDSGPQLSDLIHRALKEV